MRSLACLLAVAAMASACHSSSDKAGGSEHASPVDLTLASAGGYPPAEVVAWISDVERLSHGSVVIDVRQPWRSGDALGEQHTLGDLRSGRSDLAWVGARVFDRVGVKAFEPLLVPFLVDSYSLESRVFGDPVVRRALARASLSGVTVLGVLPGPMRRLVGFKHPFLEARDFRGQVVGLQDSALAAETLRALEAVPRPTAISVPVSGLDGYEQQLQSIAGNGVDRQARYVAANLDLWPRVIVIAAGAGALARLTPQQRSLLGRAAMDVLPATLRQAAASDLSAVSAICRAGMRIVRASPSQLASLRAAVAPIYRVIASDPETQTAMTRIEALKRAAIAPPASVPLCRVGVGPRSGTGTTAIDGSYTMTTSAADLPVRERIPELYGTWQLVLDRGRFRFTQRSDGADWVADGTFRTARDTMVWSVSDVLDKGPHGAPDGDPLRAGSTLRFRWSRSSSELNLHSLDPRPAVPAFGVRPLRRIGNAPGQERQQDPTPLFGTWTTMVTAHDVLAHHDDPSGIPDNTGPMRFTIARSHCTWAQQAPDGAHYARGKCVFAGDNLEFEPFETDANTASVPYFFDWSVFHDRLTLVASPGFAPEGWAYHAWKRVS